MTIEIVKWIQQFRTAFLDDFFNFISYLGEESIYIIVLVVIYYGVNKKFGEYIGYLLITAVGINSVLKGIFKAERPFIKYKDDVVNLRPHTSPGYSFPSGHTQTFSTVLFGVSHWVKKHYVTIIVSVLTILMAVSRMYLGVHFLEDVLVSVLLGLGFSFLIHKYYTKYGDNIVMLHRLYFITFGLLLLGLFIVRDKTYVTTVGMFLGFICAMYIEKNYVQFRLDVSLFKKVIRVIIGVVGMLLIQVSMKQFFLLLTNGVEYLILDFIRYFLLVFIGLGIVPMLFKKLQI